MIADLRDASITLTGRLLDLIWKVKPARTTRRAGRGTVQDTIAGTQLERYDSNVDQRLSRYGCMLRRSMLTLHKIHEGLA